MFDSKISVSSLITDLKTEIDVALPISNKTYITWLNGLEQLLYSEFIREHGKITINSPTSNPIDIDSLIVPANESPIRFEDIYTVFADETQLIKSSLVSGIIFPNTYYKQGADIGYNVSSTPAKLTIVYFVKPAIKTVSESDVIGTGNLMLPLEFIDLMKSKLRGEAYKLANEDSLAAKWINDYNVLLENFKAWVSSRQAQFGM
jgi:hypothetical protein